MNPLDDLPVIQQCHDLIAWFVPRLEKLPRGHRHLLGERIQTGLYELPEVLVLARLDRQQVEALQKANARREVLRHQVRLLVQFGLMDNRRYEHVSGLINEVGVNLGGWLKSRRSRVVEATR